jgi:hypothetical protein
MNDQQLAGTRCPVRLIWGAASRARRPPYVGKGHRTDYGTDLTKAAAERVSTAARSVVLTMRCSRYDAQAVDACAYVVEASGCPCRVVLRPVN